MKTLNDLEPGSGGLVTHITGPEKMCQRLMDLGLIEGARVEALCRAPLGDPILVRVLGTVIALRRNEAATIEVEPTDGECCGGGKRHRHRFGWKSKHRENQPL
jgi:ferrous iron transport protein A